MTGENKSLFRRGYTSPGAAPGTLVPPEVHVEPHMHVMTFDESTLQEGEAKTAREAAELITDAKICWLDMSGLGDGTIVEEVGQLFSFHQLALSDVVNLGQRPKIESYGDELFVVLRMVVVESGSLRWEQISLFLGESWVVTFQENRGDCLDPLRERIRKGMNRVRSSGSDYLACMILDCIVDGYFPVLEHLGETLEDLEEELLESPSRDALTKLYKTKRDLMTFRHAAWPLRDALSRLAREDDAPLSDTARLYLRDTTDHVMQIVDVVETYRELAASLVDVYLSTLSQRTNEIMRVLTIIATIFIPLTFVAGVYGMNFDTSLGNMPELGWRYGYAAFWVVSIGLAVALLLVFRRLSWLGSKR